MTQNGFVRIATGPKYPTPIGSMSQVMASLDRQISLPGHIFWSEDISLISSSVVQRDAIKVSSQVTDTYLLALAATRGGKLATFDRRISTGAVCGGPETLEVIPVGRS